MNSERCYVSGIIDTIRPASSVTDNLQCFCRKSNWIPWFMFRQDLISLTLSILRFGSVGILMWYLSDQPYVRFKAGQTYWNTFGFRRLVYLPSKMRCLQHVRLQWWMRPWATGLCKLFIPLHSWMAPRAWMETQLPDSSCREIEAETKRTPFRRRHFQMHCLEWKYMNFA